MPKRPERNFIRFLLNDREVTLTDCAPTLTLLDWLRIDRRLTGTKEGCAEGDCGACTVLVGRLAQGELVYEGVNACIRFVGSLDGCHVVTVEALARGGTLHPVQQALVEHHGSQCGFCTPGFVMSLYALWMRKPDASVPQIEKALQGNLCRCTGYAPIIRAAQAAAAHDPAGDVLMSERARVRDALAAMRDGARVVMGEGADRLILPADVDDFAAVLAEYPKATIVAGATDVGLWVTKFMRDIGPVVFIAHIDALHAISETGDGITLGACVSYSEAYPVMSRRHPYLREMWDRLGGEQVRNMGTVGGNIANGSPIGDTPPALIALDAKLRLRSAQGSREMPLEAFFIDYGKQDLREGEFVESVFVPDLPDGAKAACYKITKRLEEDITAVCAAIRMIRGADGQVADIRIAYGGMAATPKRAAAAEAALRGQPWNGENARAAMAELDKDFKPITDMRASAEYRLLAARNLIWRFWLESGGTERATRLARPAAELI